MDKLPALTRLTKRLFDQKWAPLHATRSLDRSDLRRPGVYLIAYAASELGGRRVKPSEVQYVGMTCSSGGLRERIRDFKDGVERNNYHSGARRFFRDYAGSKPLSRLRSRKKFYFVAVGLDCTGRKSQATPDDFRTLGLVPCLEYYAIAHVLERTGRTPPLNKLSTGSISERKSAKA